MSADVLELPRFLEDFPAAICVRGRGAGEPAAVHVRDRMDVLAIPGLRS